METIQKILETITGERRKILDELRRKRTDAAFRAGPTDRDAAEVALTALYRQAGLNPPLFLWTLSPLSAALFMLSLSETGRGRPRLGDFGQNRIVRRIEENSAEDLSDNISVKRLAKALDDYGAALVGHAFQGIFSNPWRFNKVFRGIHLASGGAAPRRLEHAPDLQLAGTLDETLISPMRVWLTAAVEAAYGDLWHREHALPYEMTFPRASNRSAGTVFPAVNDLGVSGCELIPHLVPYEALGKARVWRLGQALTRTLALWRDLARYVYWWWCFEKVCVVSEHPTALITKETNGRRLIHADGGPAVVFPDGWSVYALNGVRVPPEVALTPAHELDAGLMMRIRNAQVRREIVRKMGLERICADLNARVIERFCEYELISLNLDDRDRPFLKMKNPSTGDIHIEGVDPNCRTIQEALAWRNGTTEAPVVLT